MDKEERYQFMIGLICGYLEDKEDKARELEEICIDVDKFFDGKAFEWIEIY